MCTCSSDNQSPDFPSPFVPYPRILLGQRKTFHLVNCPSLPQTFLLSSSIHINHQLNQHHLYDLWALHYLRQGGYIMHGIVCLLATLHKNCWTDLRDKFTTDVPVDKEELIKFWKSSASGSGSRNFKKDFSTLRDTYVGHFYAIWLISLFKKLTGSSWKFYD